MPYGTNSSWKRHDDAGFQGRDTAIAGFAFRVPGTRANQKRTLEFAEHLFEPVPYKNHTSRTANGIQFADQTWNRAHSGGSVVVDNRAGGVTLVIVPPNWWGSGLRIFLAALIEEVPMTKARLTGPQIMAVLR